MLKKGKGEKESSLGDASKYSRVNDGRHHGSESVQFSDLFSP